MLNLHQIALCNELNRQNGGNFYFVETSHIDSNRETYWLKHFNTPYLINSTESDKNFDKALQLAKEADVAIMGAESYFFLTQRIKFGNGITFSYSERWLKKGFKNILSPSIFRLLLLYWQKGYRSRWFMLAASGFQANDMKRLHIFKNRVFKWGYFPNYPDVVKSNNAQRTRIRILWTARFIDLKRPEMMIELARKLLEHDFDFEIVMIGDGILFDKIKKKLKICPELSERVKLKGNMPNEKVFAEMADSDIFCFTSTRREGWGAVLGEAMSTGCCVVSSSSVGAAPFLINPGKNGLIFKVDDIDDLYDKVAFLIENPTVRQVIGGSAIETMRNEWSAERAAKEFISLAKMKLNNTDSLPADSNLPASLAYPTNWK